MDDIDSFHAAGEDTIELTVPDGTTYEFPESHVPYLKAAFDDLELVGGGMSRISSGRASTFGNAFRTSSNPAVPDTIF